MTASRRSRIIPSRHSRTAAPSSASDASCSGSPAARGAFFDPAVAAIFAGMVLVGTWQVFSRFVLNSTPSWSEEIQIFGHIWLVFLAIPIAYRRGAHITVEAIRNYLAGWMNKALDLINEALWLGFAVATAYYSYRVSRVTGNSVSPGLEIPMSYPYYGMILGSVYLLFVVIRRLAGELPPPSPDELPPEVASP